LNWASSAQAGKIIVITAKQATRPHIPGLVIFRLRRSPPGGAPWRPFRTIAAQPAACDYFSYPQRDGQACGPLSPAVSRNCCDRATSFTRRTHSFAIVAISALSYKKQPGRPAGPTRVIV
jgi:hypothetical protein